MGACLAGAVGQAAAQSSSAGAIFGNVGNASGATSVVIENANTGLSRTLTVDSNGRYRATSLPVGTYKVTLQENGQPVTTRENVTVTIAGAAEVSFAGTSAASAQTLEGVSVIANTTPSIDVSSVDTRTVLTAEQLQKIPVAQNVAAAALLAPGVVAGDSRFSAADGKPRLTMGGSGISENAYTINGYNITDPLSSETFFELPFLATDQLQVLTGGAGAEFGHTTGGVVNTVGKRGTNEWKASVRVDWIPESLRSSPKNLYNDKNPEDLGFGNTGGFNHGGAGITAPFGSDGKLRQYRSRTKDSQTLYSAQLGGPLIKDRLFMYAAASFQRNEGQEVNGTAAYSPNGNLTAATANNKTAGYRDTSAHAVKWYGKVDWNITDNHLLELTGLADNTRKKNDVYGWSYATLSRLGRSVAQDTATKNSNRLYIAKYTGYLTDDLTVNALYGRSKTEDPNLTNIPDYLFIRANSDSPVASQMHNYQSDANQRPNINQENKTSGWKFDIEYRLGQHDLRGGIDHQVLRSVTGSGSANIDKYGALGGEYLYLADPTGVHPLGTLQISRLKSGGKYKVDLKSYYLEDHWQISDRWLAYVGARNESFENYNSGGQIFISKKNQWAPRLGVSWDVNGDSSLKVYANAGRYFLALPNGVAVRGAGGSLFTTEQFTFTGVDPATDRPIGLTSLGPAVSANGEFGQPRDPRTARIQGLKSHYQDEYILGFDKQLNSEYTVGARAIYRNLKSQVDDTSDSRPVCKYMVANYKDFASVADCINNFSYQGVIFNPGHGAEFDVNVAADPSAPADLRHIKLSKEDLGMPDPKRKYVSLDLYAEHAFDGKWFGRVDYTWSHSYGNTEGQVKSDIAQQDVAASQDWDFPEFMRYANGSLPNDRRHQIRGFGYYQLTEDWMLSATATANSGRPKSCVGAWFPDANGVYTDPSGAYMRAGNSGGAYHVCYGTPSPRGAKGNMPWTYQLDLGVTWSPGFADHKLAFSANVFNLLNTMKTTVYEERAMGGPVLSTAQAATANGGNPLAVYKRSIDYSTPRYFRLSVQYDF
ncbi:TonB-dependent receptor [Luteibacter rhizovicinus]|uniref:TonB-dependent receptor n=1 Tax=Luteibacter rhizovicinus TaxID=242606 RepID=UPI0014055D31|nr:TonB-dependent receptor [Luteibacter rhizovicinus]